MNGVVVEVSNRGNDEGKVTKTGDRDQVRHETFP